jgi:hypothetical protein
MNEYSFDAAIKRNVPGIDGKKSWVFAKELWRMCCEYSDSVMKIKKAEEEEVRKKKEKERLESGGGGLTKEEVLAMVKASAEDGNAASQKILSEYIGLGKKEDGLVVQMVDYVSAPDWYRTEKPEMGESGEVLR